MPFNQPPQGGMPEPMNGVPNVTDMDISAMASKLAARQGREKDHRFLIGLGWAGATALTAAGIFLAHDSEEKFTVEVPFSPVAQEAVESVDDVLSTAGMGLVLLGGATIAGVKIRSRYSPLMHSIDLASSQELTDDGKAAGDTKNVLKKAANGTRGVLRNVAAGGVPVVAATGVMISGLMTSVGEELSSGPTRPIESLFGPMPQGPNGELNIVVQDAGSNPMTQSNISQELTAAIQQEAAERGVPATAMDMFLGTIYHEDQKLTSLVVGTDQAPDSPLFYDPVEAGCEDVPVAVDGAADIGVGEHISISGISAVVVENQSGSSAINRVGIEADPRVIAACLNQDPDNPRNSVALGTDQETAQEILAAANEQLNKPASVISEAQYIENSEDFWTANAKPLTNITALMSGMLAFVSMGGIMGARLLRNRREWATKLAQGVSDNQLRATELLRSVKDGMVASVVGVSAATLTAPLINFLESGLRVGMDFRSAMAASAVGILGSVLGTIPKIIRPRKIVDPAEHTRI